MGNNLQKANRLQTDIQELKRFLDTVTEFDKESKAIPSVNVLMKKKVDVKISLLGSRYFGCGTLTQEIWIPDEIRNGLIELARKRLEELEKEFNSMFN
jgi:hypothetical protein